MANAPTGEREELFAAWRAFFEHIADRGTTVLVFQDLHWADQGLLDFIESMLAWSRARPILVMALARPELMERRPTWGVGSRASMVLQLEPIGTADIADMLRGMVPGLPPGALAQIVERSEGVPLYAVETVRMLLDDGRLVRDGERYRLIDPVTHPRRAGVSQRAHRSAARRPRAERPHARAGRRRSRHQLQRAGACGGRRPRGLRGGGAAASPRAQGTVQGSTPTRAPRSWVNPLRPEAVPGDRLQHALPATGGSVTSLPRATLSRSATRS